MERPVGQHPPGPRIAFVGADRQLHTIRPDGTGRQQVSWSRIIGGLTGVPTPDGCAWPTWSPDGRWLAFLRRDPAESDRSRSVLRLCVLEVDGVEERDLGVVDGGVAVYLRWSPDGRRIAMLVHDHESLELRVCDPTDGRMRLVDSGMPLYFTWAPDSESLLVHAGSRDGSDRLVRRTLAPRGEDAVFPVRPGSFCTPLLVDGPVPQVAFAAAGSGVVSHVCVGDLDGDLPEHLATLQGLLAVVPAPEGRRIAIGSAPGGERTPYDGVFVIDDEERQLVQVTRHPCMAFAWAGGDRTLIYAAMDQEAGCARWYRCVIGDDPRAAEDQELAPFWPTPDQLFQLHFFEQYVGSHPQVSADGRWLCYASRVEPRRDAPHAVMVMDLHQEDPTPVEVARGGFAVFSPD
ncbi:MAG: PD40 domain-containing protein [Alphaproteobacteria bacterium]|nr:PD40 domain-containing protein [Alphaproteobacteria bacterium]